MSRALRDHRAAIVDKVASLPEPWAADLAEYIDRRLADAQRRAENAPRSAQSYSARVEAGIRQAVGALPANSRRLGRQNLAEQVLNWIARHAEVDGSVPRFGLKCVPDVKTVRKAIRTVERDHSEKTGEPISQSLDAVGGHSEDAAIFTTTRTPPR